jgi:hypothetical protein
MPFRRPSSRAARTLRLLTAFVTVWCLGCAAFDPVLGQLAGSADSSGMVCGDEMVGGTGGDAPSGNVPTATSLRGSPSGPSVSAAASDHHTAGYDCGCQNCHAPEMTRAAADASARPVPTAAQHEPQALVSVVREPLLPPPELALPGA